MSQKSSGHQKVPLLAEFELEEQAPILVPPQLLVPQLGAWILYYWHGCWPNMPHCSTHYTLVEVAYCLTIEQNVHVG